MSLSTLTLAAAETVEHSNPLVPETPELIWGAISFLILLLLVAKFIFPTITKTLDERTKNIEGKLEEAERQRAAAQDLLRQYEVKLNEARDEAQRIVEQARGNADRLEEELRGKAEEQARRIVERAQETINAERDRALASLRGEVGQLAVDLAAKVVGNSLDRDRQLGLVDQYIAELQST